MHDHIYNDFRAILFDMDGTLIDARKPICEATTHAFHTLRLPAPDCQTISQMIGLPLTNSFINLGMPENRIEEAVQLYRELYRKTALIQTTAMDGATEALAQAGKLAHIGIVTTKTSGYTREVLERLHMLQYVETIVGFDEVQNPKPHQEPILLALRRLGKDQSNQTNEFSRHIWMVGDTAADMGAALGAQISFARVTGFGFPLDTRVYPSEYFVETDNVLSAVTQISKRIQ